MHGLLPTLMLLAATVAPATAPVGAAAAPAPTARLAWLAGCWELRRGDRVTEEHWLAPRGGMMLGLSRTAIRDTIREHEFMRVDVRDGRLVFTAYPSGQSPGSFPAIEVTDSSVVFADPAHDFPQRIRYARHGADSLLARIEGLVGGRTRRVDYPMRRVPCDDAR